MDAIRLFFRSNSFRTSKVSTNLTPEYSRTISTPDERNISNNNLSTEIDDNQSSSNEKLSRENIKSFLTTQSPSNSVLSNLSATHFDLETCSGLSTPSSENGRHTIVAASASESISNALTFTNNHSSKRRRSSNFNDKRRRSWINEQTIHHPSSLSSPPFRRTKSHGHPDRRRKHSLKTKHPREKLTKRYIQVNK